MSGDPLSNLMRSGPLSAAEAVRIVRDAASALTAVHGELSPSSILVRDDGVEIIPPAGGDRTRYGQHASPERILGKAATPESDVFSLGAILYHAIAGRPPFRGATPSEVMLAACTEPPLEMPAQVPHALEKIIMCALSKPPRQRYPAPAALRDALDSYASQRTWEGRRVLAVDDDQPMRVLYQRMMTRIGVDGDLAETGRAAVDALKTNRYNVMLLDLNLPRLNGWEVLDFLRARPDARPRHLFIITGFVDQRVSEADRDLVTAVLYKPVAQDELQTLVTECLRGPLPDLPQILRKTSHRAGTAV
ncbi:MAG TPA: response regulator [Thermoanaerobaculia bacterium]|nr:response regulator [Thermoanaerobaculia bacterium]